MTHGGMAVSFIREKKIYCGKKYLEVDIYPIPKLPRKKRRAKKAVSAPKQKNLNDKNAKRYLRQSIDANFDEKDLHVTATYATLPESIEEGERMITNFLRRVAYRRKRDGLPPLKYILVTEYSTGKEEKPTRLHHHLIMNGGLDRDELENLWRAPRDKGQKQGKIIGFINADRLKPNESGLTALANYLTKNPKGKKRWSSSRNLIKPVSQVNDQKYTRRQVEKIVRDEIDNQLYWKKKYPNWDVTECKPVYNDITGWSIYLKLRRGGGT